MLIDHAFGDLGQQLIGIAFFLDSCLQQFYYLVKTTHLSVAASRAIGGNFVMLDALGCAEGTVAWRIHEARRRLRDLLGDLVEPEALAAGGGA